MPRFPSVLTTVGLCLSGVFLAFFVLFPVEIVPPPKKSIDQLETNVPEDLSVVEESDSFVASPWIAPVRAPVAADAVVTPSPAPSPVQRVDTTSLVFVGSANTQSEGKKYFFKVQATGQVLSLIVGQNRSGWTLLTVEGNKFSIVGPGGKYEVIP